MEARDIIRLRKRFGVLVQLLSVQKKKQARERRREPLEEGKECLICFKVMRPADSRDACDLLTFCVVCGQNLHRDCVARCQRASSGECPLCRAASREPSRILAPGEALPPPAPPVAPPLCDERESCSGGYMNLMTPASGRTSRIGRAFAR